MILTRRKKAKPEKKTFSEMPFISDVPDVCDISDVTDIADVGDVADVRVAFDAADDMYIEESRASVSMSDAAQIETEASGSLSDASQKEIKAASDDMTPADSGSLKRGTEDLREIIRAILKENRIRLILIAVGVLLIIAYRIIRSIDGASYTVYQNVIKPFHGFLASVFDHTDLCVAEILITVLVVATLVYIILKLVDIIYPVKLLFYYIKDLFVMIFIPYGRLNYDEIRAYEFSHRLGFSLVGRKSYRIASRISAVILTLVMVASLAYGGFCILWGFYYAAPGVKDICGIEANGVAHEDLVSTDRYFLEKANEFSYIVARSQENDESAPVFVMTDSSFEHSRHLYGKVALKYPALDGRSHTPKKVSNSKIVSLLDFTGFFFPFTAESCINMDSPDCMRPATIAHEISHQKGIAAEDEANFIGILACMEDDHPDYVYSASLMALVYLQNALYASGDTETWQEISDSYSPGVRADIDYNSKYWSAYRKKVLNRATTRTYDAFLKSYDQEMGRETYGACVDYLVAYYGKRIPE